MNMGQCPPPLPVHVWLSTYSNTVSYALVLTEAGLAITVRPLLNININIRQLICNCGGSRKTYVHIIIISDCITKYGYFPNNKGEQTSLYLDSHEEPLLLNQLLFYPCTIKSIIKFNDRIIPAS